MVWIGYVRCRTVLYMMFHIRLASVVVFIFFFYGYGGHRDLLVLTHSFPTRRSSDLRPTCPRCPTCNWTWASASRCCATGQATNRSTARPPTPRTWSNCRYATTTAACASCRRCCREPPTYPPTTCR